MSVLPPVSIVVPVHNEALLVEREIRRMRAAIAEAGLNAELIICENGSADETARIVEGLAREDATIRLERLDIPDYGGAMRLGIHAARHDLVVIFNIDFWSIEFARTAVALLHDCDMVVGSKVMAGADDRRPAFRRSITRAFNGWLRVAYGFKGTDTHGMKAFRRSTTEPVLGRCVTKRSIFDTELVLRAERAGLRICEVPVSVVEIRQPSYWAVIRRLPEVTANLAKLTVGLRGERRDRRLFYDQIADSFDDIANPYDLHRRIEVVFDELLAGHPLEGRRLLDVGCGTGWFSQRAAAEGARVVSLDLGQRLLSRVRQKCASELVAADACVLPFRDGAFDVVISSECIEHTLDPLAAVREMARVVRPGGVLVVTTPNWVWRWSATVAAVLKLRPYEGYEHWVGWRQLRRELEGQRLQVDCMRGFHLVPPLIRATWPLLRAADRSAALVSPFMLNMAARARK